MLFGGAAGQHGHVRRRGGGKLQRYTWQDLAAGYAAVWATDNTREAIWEAFKRKETYATSGTRMTVRFFGGYDFAPGDAKSPALAETGYAKGVSMGGDLAKAPAGRAPTFLVAALKDPQGANLDPAKFHFVHREDGRPKRVRIARGTRFAVGDYFSLRHKDYAIAGFQNHVQVMGSDELYMVEAVEYIY